MASGRIKYGLAGYGLNGWAHTMELKIAPLLRGRTEFIACFDPDPKNQANLSKRKNVKVAQSFEDLLDTPKLDAIIISSPPQFHADQVVAGLEAGKHIYSEVPMALTTEEIERIIAAEEHSGKKYQLGENYAFFSEVLYAGSLISSGKIGPGVYAESEYLHDVTYRWRQGLMGGPDTPRIDSWYSLIEPMQYAHTIGPAQVALGGIKSPAPFIEVKSYINSNGGYQRDPVSRPSGSFQVALFRTETNAVAKCANAFVIAREPTRMMIQVIGRTGSYECYRIGKPGRQFIADGHEINRLRHRKGKSQRVGKFRLASNVPLCIGTYHGAQPRIMDDWFTAIEKDYSTALNAKVAANMCMAGICAARSAHQNSPVSIPVYTTKK